MATVDPAQVTGNYGRRDTDSGRGRGGFSNNQRVNTTPPLTSNNPFTCLSVELIETDDTSETIVVPSPNVNPPTLKRWERRLPKKYVVSAIPSVNSLDLRVEIETLDPGLPLHTNALADSGADGI